LEQIHGGAAGAGCVWLTSFGAELIFLDLELCGALPNTPLISKKTWESDFVQEKNMGIGWQLLPPMSNPFAR
jgi:hypothetical protein